MAKTASFNMKQQNDMTGEAFGQAVAQTAFADPMSQAAFADPFFSVSSTEIAASFIGELRPGSAAAVADGLLGMLSTTSSGATNINSQPSFNSAFEQTAGVTSLTIEGTDGDD